MKKSDFDEVTRLMLIRDDIAEILEKLRRAEDHICSLDAISFGCLSEKLSSEVLTVDLEKLSIDVSDRPSILLNAVRDSLRTYLTQELREIETVLVAKGINFDE